MENLPYRPEYDHNEKLRKKFPNCTQCEVKLVYGALVVGIMRDGVIVGQLCSIECLEKYNEEVPKS